MSDNVLKVLEEFVKNLTKEDLERIGSAIREFNDRDVRHGDGKDAKDERKGTCVVCSGVVIARVTREYRGDPNHVIIGPGHANQLTTIHHGFHCTRCGLRYEFLPEHNVLKKDHGD